MLSTARLLLRPARPTDLDDMFAIYGNPDAMRYWSTAPHPDRETTAAQLDRVIAGNARQTKEFGKPTYLMFECEGRMIGSGGLYRDDEIGFILHPEYWRRGFAREAMTALIPFLFKTTGLDQLTADADPNNAASCGLLMSLGFRETHRAKNTFCIDDVWSDSVYFRLDRG